MQQQTKPAPYVAAVILRLIMAGTFVLLIALAMTSAIEINGRQQLLRVYEGQLEDAMRELESASAMPAARAPMEQRVYDLQLRIDGIRERIVRGDNELKAVVLTGGTATPEDLAEAGPLSASESLARQLSEAQPDEASSPYWFTQFLIACALWFVSLSSDQLLAIAVIAAAVLGAMVGGLRREDLRYLRPMLAGLAAGFITYLAIRGLRGVFMTGSEGPTPDFNAFSATLAGLIAGLFFERIYGLFGRRAWKQQQIAQAAVAERETQRSHRPESHSDVARTDTHTRPTEPASESQ